MTINHLTYEQKKELLKLLEKREQFKIDNRLDFMRWELYDKQNVMRDKILRRIETRSGPNIFVVFGGNRSGKSELGGGIVAECFKKFGKLRMWCATLSDLSVKVQQRKCNDLIRKVDIHYGEYNEVRGWKNNTIISKKDSVIYFKTYEQGAQAFQGDDIDVAWFDEECPYDVFSETLIRLGDRSGIIILTFTSLMGFTRLVNRLWESNDTNVITTVLTAFENPFLSNAVKEQLLSNIDPDEIRSRWEGKPHLKQGLIYKEFSLDVHRIESFDYKKLIWENPRRYKLHEGIDPHPRTPHHWLRFLYDVEQNILYVVAELKAPVESMMIDTFSSLIKARRGREYRDKTLSKPEICQIDTSAMVPITVRTSKDDEQNDIASIRTEFFFRGIDTVLVQKDNAIGIASVKERLRFQRGHSDTFVKAPRLYIFKGCTGFIWEMTRYSWDAYESSRTSEKKELINKPFKKDDHFMDILKYECIYLKNYIDDDALRDTLPDKSYYDDLYKI